MDMLDVPGTTIVRGSLDDLAGRTLRGTVITVSDAPAPFVQIYDGRDCIGIADLHPGPYHSDGDRWAFRFPLPDDLYDGRVHAFSALAFDIADRPLAGTIAFLGDPAIVNRSLRRTATTPQAAPPVAAPAPAASPNDAALVAVMSTLSTQTRALAELISRTGVLPESSALAPAGAQPVVELSERYGWLYDDAAAKPHGRDFLWFGVIDWDFRLQRPQHLCTHLADLQNRVFYVSIVFEKAAGKGRFTIVKSPHPGVYEVRLRLSGSLPENIYGGFTPAQSSDILAAVDELMAALDVSEPVAVVQYPSWYGVANGIAGVTVVHDCLDLVSGFNETPGTMVQLEAELIRDADLVVVSSKPLADHVAEQRTSTIVRNAADVDFFAGTADAPSREGRRPVIGYFGAISHWYEVDWIAQTAKARPEWDFVLIGSTHGTNVAALSALENVTLLGERPYAELPQHLSGFDVAIIPFKLLDLIMCTNPVKLYEYMAAGKPVVASAMPEVVEATDLVYIAHDAASFEAQISRAMDEDNPDLRAARRRWAAQHNWDERAGAILDALAPLSPAVSVVVLAFNNWAFTRACLDSVLRYSDYTNLEVIVVDNGSTDGTPERLTRQFAHDPRVKVVLNDENLGYAGGNNTGIRASSGDYVVLLNNDTFVTRGWVRDLIRPLQQDPSLGIAVPLTNNMGNEQKIAIAYRNMHEMRVESRRFVRKRTRRRYPVDTVAFFCVALTRDTIERVGLLDETYGVGFFEDDDYCRRAQAAGIGITIVDDVFVHHHLSASFNALGAERKQTLMKRNKAIYEARWGPWKPHTYRTTPGFG